MFDNLTMEIFYYSLIPVVVIAIISLIALVLSRKSEDNRYKYSYIIRVLLIVMISLVLPLITGYTIWVTLRYISKGILLTNIVYVITLIVLTLALIILLIVICRKLFKIFEEKKSFK